MKKSIFTLFCVALAIVGCNSQKEKTIASIEKQWELVGFSQPESVLSVPNQKWLYVSNVNGKETGYISKISKDGKIDNLKWVEGIQNPTGMAFYEGNIYVVNQDRIHLIDIEKGAIIKTIKSSKAKTLNDISITSDGQAFISDLTTGSIYTIQGADVVLWVKSDYFPFPNGVLVHGDNLIVGNIGSRLAQDLKPEEFGALYKVSLLNKSVQQLEATNKLGSIDGIIETKSNGLIISNPFTNEVIYIKDGKHEVIAKVEGGIADIGSDIEREFLYAPLLFGNKVIAYSLKGKMNIP